MRKLEAVTRRRFAGQLAGAALAAATTAKGWAASGPKLARAVAAAAGVGQSAERRKLPNGTLICVWEHEASVNIAPVVKEVGFNTVWTHDKPYDGKMKLEDTLMWRHMQTPGVKYVVAKIDRGIWGWTFEQSMRHAEWIANLTKTEKRIIGLYLNDFYQEVHSITAPGGHHTLEQFRQIIARTRSINPDLPIFVPIYPTKELNEPYDFDFDALICNIHFDLFDRKMLPSVEQSIDQIEKRFAGKPILTGLYFQSGTAHGGVPVPPLSEEEFRFLMGIYVRHINEGKTKGLRIYRAKDFVTHPQYVTWAKEELAKLTSNAS